MSVSVSNWQTQPLGELATTTSGGTPSRTRKDYYVGSIPWVKSGELNDDYIFDTEEHITEAGLKNSSAKLFPSGTVLIALYGATVGKTSILRINASTNQAVCGITPGPELDGEYLRYHLISLRRELLSHRYGGAQPNISQQIVRNQKIAFPPLPEQKKIAHILSTVQRAIEAQERILQTTTELKKALMHKLFTEGLRHEAQKQTEIGPVPESWKVVKLGEIAKIERGKFSHRPRNAPRFYGGEYPFVQTGDVSNCDGYVRSYTQTLNEAGLAISKMFPAGTILITIAANIGFTGILEFDSACPDSLIGITPHENVHTEFLNYYLITQQLEMDRLAPKNTQKNINIQFLKPWPVPLPSVEEQTEMAGAFSATDRKIRLATQKRSLLQDLFRTLLHELMTAKTRVAKIV